MTDLIREINEKPKILEEWYQEHKAEFVPPICNRLMHKNQMTVMFVGGPNKRRDFHLDRGSEFFYQIRGDMKLPIIIGDNDLRIVTIKEGEVFCLPSCVLHSPQRLSETSLGMVIERERYPDEPDGLRYFTGFDFPKDEDEPEKMNVNDILWERFFYCESLGQSLVPVVKAFLGSEQCKSNKPCEDEKDTDNYVKSWRPKKFAEPRFPVNKQITDVPAPFSLQKFLDENVLNVTEEDARKQLAAEGVRLFPESHPDKEYDIRVCRGCADVVMTGRNEGVETFFYQLEGTCTITVTGNNSDGDGKSSATTHVIEKTGCFIVDAGKAFSVSRENGDSVGMVVIQRPRLNEQFYGYTGWKPEISY